MRAALGLILCSALLGCGDDGSSSPDMTALPPDMATPPLDMSPPLDLTTKKLGCNGILMCIQNGGSPTTWGGMGTSHGQQLLLAAAQCGQGACMNMTSTDASMDCTGGVSDFSDPTCQACIAGVLQNGAAGSGPCKNQVAACLA